jgi:hypothetical protein
VRTGLVLALCAVCGTAGAVQDSSTSVMAPPTHAHGAIAFVWAPVVVAAGGLVGRFPQGSKLMRSPARTAGVAVVLPPAVLTPEFFAVGDPAISFDGTRLLFSGQQRRGERWQIWEMAVAGGEARQVTHCVGDCLKAVYLAGDQMAYTALSGVGAERDSEIFVSALSAVGAHAITFGPGRFEVETALRSGRLLVSRAGVGGRALYVLNPDGSGLGLLRRDGRRGVFGGAVELEDGTVAFVEWGVGVEWIRPGALHAAVMARGVYASVGELGEGLLVSRGGNLYRVDLKRDGREALVYRGGRGVSVQAVEIAAHATVLAYPSILHPERTTGRILCLDAYATEDVASGRVAGRLAAHVARVRVVAKEPRGERVLGEAPVELDGSFYATVPADTAIRLELVGTKGEVAKAQRSWMWVRGGEDRGCPGCHESQALAAENRSPMALQRFDTPSVLVADKLKAVRP